MPTAKHGDKVLVHYTGRLEDGHVFDSSQNAGDEAFRNFRGKGVAFAPMQLVIGEGTLPPPVEEALVGLEPGQSATVRIPCENGFGPRREDRVLVLPHEDLAPDRDGGETRFRVAEGRQAPNVFNPRIGDLIEVTGVDGARVPARITGFDANTVTIDTNHPLAGHDLLFDVTLVGIR